MSLPCNMLPVKNSLKVAVITEDHECNSKSLYGHSHSYTLTSIRHVAGNQGVVLEMHVSRSGLVVSSCQKRFWGSWFKLKSGTKQAKKKNLKLFFILSSKLGYCPHSFRLGKTFSSKKCLGTETGGPGKC